MGSIRPEDFPGALPIVSSVSLKLGGRDIPQEFIMMPFGIPQKRAFEILGDRMFIKIVLRF